jgi:hypothetical protein
MFGGAPAFNTNPIQPNSTQFAPQPMNPMNAITQQPTMGWEQQGYGYPDRNNMNGTLPPPPQQMMRNPTPPPGWNDPPEFKPKAQVS